MSAQNTGMGIPMASVANVTFRPDLVLVFDFSGYEAGAPGREIEVVLMGPFSIHFEDKDADEFYMWYLRFTGQNQVVGAVPMVAPGTGAGH